METEEEEENSTAGDDVSDEGTTFEGGTSGFKPSVLVLDSSYEDKNGLETSRTEPDMENFDEVTLLLESFKAKKEFYDAARRRSEQSQIVDEELL